MTPSESPNLFRFRNILGSRDDGVSLGIVVSCHPTEFSVIASGVHNSLERESQ